MMLLEPPPHLGRMRWIVQAAVWLAPSFLTAWVALMFWILAPDTVPVWMRVVVFGNATLMLVLNALQLRRWGGFLRSLELALRNIAQGRLEARLPGWLPPGLQEIGVQMNLVSQQMLGYRDQLERRMQAAVGRLRADLDQAKSELRLAQQNLGGVQKNFRQQSELFSGMTHELRTPLTAILGFSDLLRKTRLTELQDDYLATLDRSARGLLSMLNDVLDWSRIEAGRLSLNLERFDLADAVEDVVALLAPLAYEKQLELVHIIYHDVPLQLDGDAQRLRQILTNLLSNAIKFTEHGEVVLRVMKEREQGKRVWLRASVTDSGSGLTEQQRARLFVPFEQFQGGNRHPGTGLGLTIVKKLVDLMSGSITVESEPGQGSTFSVLLEFGASPTPVQTWEHLRNRTIWTCETHPTAGLALSHSLQFWGIEVTSFDELAPLVSRLRHAPRQNRPDLVIVGVKPADLLLEAMQALGSLCMDAHPPLLALLTSASPSDQQEAIDLGAARALPKSVGRLQLYRELCDLVRSGHTKPMLEGQTLLIADNNPSNLRYLAALGRELGASVLEARDGDEAMAIWRQRGCDFALIDYRMPGLDGLGVVRLIRSAEIKKPAEQRTRLVATSAHLAPHERQALREAGADEVLIKPFDEAQLLRALTPRLARELLLPPGPSRLAQDAELLELLCEELPLQLKDLEDAFARGDAVAARAAAHTLNGSAAFYQLAQLKAAASDMEEQLAASAFSGVVAGGLPRLRAALHETLEVIGARTDSENPT
ncbi:MAG: response regulator [Hydrocarboniphaga sp.]|uniref:ATP-binding protein n=1 Tax=Hydrocarboniphaga sp. TaxID=2033016 RepID=UPI00263A1ED6|nr:ATP-binding protein [Hydrocarboniphaga sp.]MDB5967909.1 response regulator [Hydrocarboniphaga sp.]